MKKTLSIFACTALLLLTLQPVLAGGPDMKEGLWEITVNMTMPGVPMQLPPQVHTECMTKDNLIPTKGPVKNCSGCKIIDTTIKGDTVFWIEECSASDGTVRAEGKITYSGESLKGRVKVTQKNMTMWQDVSGRWVASCQE